MVAARSFIGIGGALLGALLTLVCETALAASSVRGLRMSQASDHTRFVFDLSGPSPQTLSHAASPDRLILDLGDSRLAGSLQLLDLAGSPVQRIRSGMFNATDLRVVFDLAVAAEAKSFLLPPGDGFGHRLVLDVYPRAQPEPPAGVTAVQPSATPPASADVAKPVDVVKSADATKPADAIKPADVVKPVVAASTKLPAAAVPPTPVAASASTAAPVAAVAKEKKAIAPRPVETAPLLAPLPPRMASGRDILIAIDAGHGGDDPGALGPRRVREKDVVLAIARELAGRVNQQPGYRAMLVRKGDYFIPLRKRRDIARAAGADLFVSIHADAFTHSRARGSSVYALSPRGATSVSAAFLAERENGADLIGNVNLGEKDDMLAGVLTDLSMTATMDASLGVGARVLGAVGRVSILHKNRVEQAGFAVLKSPDMPSILVETGFISNPTEAERLNTRAYQQRMAKAIFEGLGNYFLNTPPPDTRVAALVRSGARPSEYVIARGDTLSGIAERYRVSVSEIVRTNRLGGAGGIQAGQRILIPES